MLAPQSPFAAYREDVYRLDLESDIGPSDAVWLLLAHCLGRLSESGDYLREQLAAQCGEALRDLGNAPAEGCEPETSEDFQRLIEGLSRFATPAGADLVARAVRGYALKMSEAGALSLAYSTLHATREAGSQASDRERGLLAADQARVARLLGELGSADELYRVAGMIGERAEDTELLARCALGRGVLARVRGNYPRATHFFSTGLSLARSAGALELEYYSHQGMTITSSVTGDYDAGIRHGWCAYALGAGEATRESESLTNLAEVCLLAGYPVAALRAFLSSLARADVLRVRLPALAGAAIAAGRTGDRGRLGKLAAEIQHTVERSGLPYENADALCSLSAAYLALGDELCSERYRQGALRIASEKRFNEIVHKTERERLSSLGAPTPRCQLGQPSAELVAGLESFEPEADETAFAATLPG
ncbi:MAG: hypothetical protein ACT4OZ_11585 [Gemmatimonadota bacterium]